MLNLLWFLSLLVCVQATTERTSFIQSVRRYGCDNYPSLVYTIFTCEDIKIKKGANFTRKESKEVKIIYCTSDINKTSYEYDRCLKFNTTREVKNKNTNITLRE